MNTAQYFDYHETMMILLCRYPGCTWEQEAGEQEASGDDMEQDPPAVFVEHFAQAHDDQPCAR